MVEFVSWLTVLYADFLLLSATQKITFSIGILGFVAALLGGSWKLFGRKTQIPPGSPKQVGRRSERIIQLIESGNASAAEATELARALYGSVDQTSYRFRSGQSETDDAATITELTGGDEERRAFANVVSELATSDNVTDRQVVLNYARGNYDAAIFALKKRADAAGDEGAPIWRELAALAQPHNQATAIEALQKAISLDKADILSMCRLARAYLVTDQPKEAVITGKQAVDASTDAAQKARSLVRLSDAYRADGDFEKAVEAAQMAVRLAREAASQAPDDVNRARVLANSFENQSTIQVGTGHLVDACENIANAIRIYEKLLLDNPADEETLLDISRARFSRAHLEETMGDLQASAATLENALQFATECSKKHPENLWLSNARATGLLQLAFVLVDLAKEDEALECARKAAEIAREIISRDPDYAAANTNLIWALVFEGRIFATLNRIDQALQLTDEAVKVARSQAASGTTTATNMLAVALNDRGNLAMRLGDVLRAEESHAESASITDQIADADPTNLSKRRDAILGTWKLGEVAVANSKFDVYKKLIDDNLVSCRELVEKNPGNWAVKELLAHAYSVARHAALLNDRESEAVELGRKTLDLYSASTAANPSNVNTKNREIDARRALAASELSAGNTKIAVAHAEKAFADISALIKQTDNQIRWASTMNLVRSVLAKVCVQTGDLDRALSLHAAACKEICKQHEDAPEVRPLRNSLLWAHLEYGNLLNSTYEAEKALSHIEEAELLIDRSTNRPTRDDQVTALVVKFRKQQVLEALGRRSEAEKLEQQIIVMAEENARDPHDLNAQKNLLLSYDSQAVNAIRKHDLPGAQKFVEKMELQRPKLVKNKTYYIQSEQWIIERKITIAAAGNDVDKMRPLLSRRVDFVRAEAAKDPSNLGKRQAVIEQVVRNVLAEMKLENGKGQFDPLITEAEALESKFPGNRLVARTNTDVWLRLALGMNENGWFREAIKMAERAEVCQKTKLQGETGLNASFGFMSLKMTMATSHIGLGQLDQAEKHVRLAEKHHREYAKYSEDTEQVQNRQIKLINLRRDIAVDRGELELSNKYIAKAETLARKQTAKFPEKPQSWVSLADALFDRSGILIQQGKLNEAEPFVQEGGEVIDKYCSLLQNEDTSQIMLALHHTWQGQYHMARGEIEKADDLAQRSHSVFAARQDREATVVNTFSLARSFELFGRLEEARSDKTKALSHYAKAHDLIDQLAERSPDMIATVRERLHYSYLKANLTGDDNDMAAVVQQYRQLIDNGHSPGIEKWAIDLQSDPRVTG